MKSRDLARCIIHFQPLCQENDVNRVHHSYIFSAVAEAAFFWKVARFGWEGRLARESNPRLMFFGGQARARSLVYFWKSIDQTSSMKLWSSREQENSRTGGVLKVKESFSGGK